LTNYHVIENADRVTVTEGETELDATVVGSDANLDIAILFVPGLELPAVPLGDSDAIQVGEYAIVIGNPLGQQFERSVTVGFVSAVSRTMEGRNRDRYGLMSKSENKMIQVDAAISSGNSGGGLFNTLGQLQGIPSMKLVDNNQSFFSASSYSIDNIGMCVPINAAKPLIKSVLESFDEAAAIAQAEIRQGESSQNPARPRIGVTVATMAPSYLPVAQGLLPQGAYIVAVEANSPAETAGLQAGDIVVEANGDIVKTQTQLIEKLQTLKEGDFAQLKVYRVEGLPEALEDSNLLDSLEQGEYMDFSVQLLMLDPVGM
jgi:serine protease Do